MDFYEVLKKRRSIRSYKSLPIPSDVLPRIAEAVMIAPSACNRQPVRILIVENPDLLKKICKIYANPWLSKAPAIAILQGDEEAAWRRSEGDSVMNIDAAIAMEHFILAATAEGLSTCWICAFPRKNMDDALETEAPWQTIAISPLGYADAEPRTAARKATSQMVKVVL